ncbi:MAG TPA: hypothetical protein VEX61_03390, partial [Burkholderiales bacterium]|nr:hypothetical protein [Burkholderiales bacterium]
LYVWGNIGERMDGMHDPEGVTRNRSGPFIKAGSRHPTANGGRAYYFHNTAPDAGAGIARSGGPTYNFVARNNLWPASRVTPQDGPFDLGREDRVERIPNFNDRDPRPQAGAQRAGAPPMRSGAEAYIAGRSAD